MFLLRSDLIPHLSTKRLNRNFRQKKSYWMRTRTAKSSTRKLVFKFLKIKEKNSRTFYITQGTAKVKYVNRKKYTK